VASFQAGLGQEVGGQQGQSTGGFAGAKGGVELGQMDEVGGPLGRGAHELAAQPFIGLGGPGRPRVLEEEHVLDAGQAVVEGGQLVTEAAGSHGEWPS
jgi:hypothetical protein